MAMSPILSACQWDSRDQVDSEQVNAQPTHSRIIIDGLIDLSAVNNRLKFISCQNVQVKFNVDLVWCLDRLAVRTSTASCTSLGVRNGTLRNTATSIPLDTSKVDEEIFRYVLENKGRVPDGTVLNLNVQCVLSTHLRLGLKRCVMSLMVLSVQPSSSSAAECGDERLLGATMDALGTENLTVSNLVEWQCLFQCLRPALNPSSAQTQAMYDGKRVSAVSPAFADVRKIRDCIAAHRKVEFPAGTGFSAHRSDMDEWEVVGFSERFKCRLPFASFYCDRKTNPPLSSSFELFDTVYRVTGDKLQCLTPLPPLRMRRRRRQSVDENDIVEGIRQRTQSNRARGEAYK
ncbi:hypothetical protein B0H14DRAFT_2572665 [Mycena olivaceomarginata]|nr:hypothetical protein B0H14DRAFT_2572665 [Mycena olivaceomarginata]